jgi:hypothetical protein
VIRKKEVLVVDLEDKPAELGKVCRLLAYAEINIDFFSMLRAQF